MAVLEAECLYAKSRSSSSTSISTYYLAKCVIRGSVVLHGLCGHIRSPSSLDVVFGKMLRKDLLTVISDSGKLSFLTFCNEMHSGCFIAASAYVNRLALFSTSVSTGSDIVDKIVVPKILDGDILTQFLELISMQQESVLSSPVGSLRAVVLSSPVGSLRAVRKTELKVVAHIHPHQSGCATS